MNNTTKNKPFTKFIEEAQRDIYAVTNEQVSCEQGHSIFQFACTTYVGNELIPMDVKNKGQGIDDTKKLTGNCKICSSAFIRSTTNSKKLGDIQFWMYGEWRERKL